MAMLLSSTMCSVLDDGYTHAAKYCTLLITQYNINWV